MERQEYDFYVLRGTLLGFLGGVLLMILVVIFQLLSSSEPLSWVFFKHLNASYPAMYLIYSLPFVAGVVMYYISRATARIRNEAQALRKTTQEHFTELNTFVSAIRSGKTIDYRPASNDTLGMALVSLQDDLARSREEEAVRQREDQIRRWNAEGLAQFGEILRSEITRIEDLAYNIVSSLVKYIEANQCGYYMVEGEGEERYFRLLACYAYDRRKFADQRIEWGDGLVGACALEGVTTHLDHVPSGYLRITSGLGQATPQNLMLIPVRHDTTVFGVLEIASFKKFEPHVVEFVERVATTIASTLSSKRINIQTAQLLAESRQQAEALVAQEELMRQNMEELQATQEEAARQSETFVSFTNSVNETLIRAEYSVDGFLMYSNPKFMQKLEYLSTEEVMDKHISFFFNPKDRELVESLWEDIVRSGRPFEGDIKLYTRNGKDLWTIAAFTSVKDQQDRVERILFLAIDTTRDKLQNLDWQGQMEALNRVSMKVELSPLGDVLAANDKFFEILGYERDAVLRHPFVNVIVKNEQAVFERTLEQVCKGEDFEGTLRAQTVAGQECWLRISMTTVLDMYGDIAKVVLIANDITREKLMEMETRRQTEQLKAQEEQLRRNEVELQQKLHQAREEVKNQFKEIEKVQIRNEKTLEGFLDAIITTDQDGVVEFFNRAAEELFAIERTEVLGQNIRLLFPEDVITGNEFLEGYLSPTGTKIIGERREVNIRAANGEERSVLMLLSEARIGRKVSYTAFVQNISLDLF
ncbi:MAG: PAS domain S-box protein [Bacteroides sp.]